jgi:hypothetical protein
MDRPAVPVLSRMRTAALDVPDFSKGVSRAEVPGEVGMKTLWIILAVLLGVAAFVGVFLW